MARLRHALVVTAALCVAIPRPAHAEPKAAVESVADEELRERIERAIGETDEAPTSRFEARRRAREAGEDAIAVLRSEGYYAYIVEPDVADAAEDDAAPPRPLVRIEPGPRFILSEPEVEWLGAAPQPPIAEAAVAAMDLELGQPGRAADVLGAEGRVVAAVQKRGYADAIAEPRQVIVDHATSTVQPTFRIAAGDLVRLNGVEVKTEGRTNPLWVGRLAPWTAGEPYDPEDVAELERRLLDTGVYDAVTVALQPRDKATAEGYRPVLVSLADRPPRTIELGVGFSTSEGVGVDGRWTRYNRLRRADTLQITARLAQIEQRLEGRVILPHWRRPQRTLTLASAVFNEETDAYDQRAVTASADLTRRYGKTSYLTWGAALDLARIAEKVVVDDVTVLGEERDTATATLLGAFALDRSDDPLDPTTGWRAEGRAEPTLVAGDVSLGYLRTQAQGTIYFPFGEAARTIAAGRLRLGAILGGDIPGVPAARRFYAGGGGSVRGYAYQAIGPRLPDNTPQGGLSLFEASAEVRHKFTARWGGVAFIDAGAVGTEATPTGDDYSVGAGIGVRYDLGFGPIRADIAVPLDKREGDPSFQVYLSIGQSF
ncbi:MAG TPA: autotransporter assembly complex family protein [Caulobacteraceae bacterium]|nr:autotransporter assembly complex family protein [Caulobacteraceae bacterium]